MSLLTMSAPPQHPPPSRTTYSRTLSALCKTELVQLSVKFKLPTNSNVLVLRNQLRVYMNYHWDVLMNNPRYRPLFPRVRVPNIPIQRLDLSSQTLRTCSSSALSYDRSPSPTPSFESWNGIGDDQAPIPFIQPHQPSPQPLHPLPLHQDPNVYHHPPPSPSTSESSADSLPQAADSTGGRKFTSPLFISFRIFLLRHYGVAPLLLPFGTLWSSPFLPFSIGTLCSSLSPFLLGTLWSSYLFLFHLGTLWSSVRWRALTFSLFLDTMQSPIPFDLLCGQVIHPFFPWLDYLLFISIHVQTALFCCFYLNCHVLSYYYIDAVIKSTITYTRFLIIKTTQRLSSSSSYHISFRTSHAHSLSW